MSPRRNNKADGDVEIVQTGDPVLREKAKDVPVTEITGTMIQNVVRRMTRALDREPDGVAIAAPQIGIPLRIFIVSGKAFDLEELDSTAAGGSPRTPHKHMVCINPRITKRSKKKVRVPEGCLSVRWLYGNTVRHEKATVQAYDEKGKLFTYGGSGLIAQIFQHENDHLDGILFTDHATEIEEIPPEKQEEIRKMQKGS